MAGGGRSRSRPRRPAKHRSNEPSSSTTIQSLGEDLLLDIFLRLPSLATLVRAALTCRAWRRAVSSSPAFRHRFRALHPQPLLGLFFEDPSPAQIPINPALPAFVPTRHRNRDLSAAVRGGDFFLTFLEDLPNEGLCWDIVDSCGGCVLLMNWDDGELVVFNPVTRWSGDAFDMSAEGTFEGSPGNHAMIDSRLIFSDEDPASFLVMLLAHDESRVRVTFFSSDTWEWSVLSWVNVSASSDPHERWIQIEGGMKANGIIYYVYLDRSHIISVDTTTMELSVAELPGLPDLLQL